MAFSKVLLKFLPMLAAIILGFIPQGCRGTELTFDDLPDPGQDAPAVPDGYGGINWLSGGWGYFSEIQPPYTAHSGTNRAFSYNADNRFFFVGSPVIFDGAWFSGGSNYDDGTPTNDKVTIDLYYAGAMVAQSGSLDVSATPAFLSSGYTGLVDAVGIAETVVRPANTDFVMDDVTFHAAETPEPAGLGLLAIGILLVGWKARRSLLLGSALLAFLAIAVVPAQADFLYATRYDGSVTQIDTTTDTATTYVSGLTGGAGGLAFDRSGNLYVTDYTNNSIVRFSPDKTSSVFASGLNNPAGLAIDTAGNIYVANYVDNNSGSIERFSPSGAGSTFVSGLNGPVNLTFDNLGNLFVANYDDGTVERISPDGTGSIFASGLNGPVGLAFDSFGNLYVSTDSDSQNQAIVRYTPQGVSSQFTSTSPYYPDGLAFDSSGNLYAGHDGDGLITEISADGSQRVLSTGTPDTTSFLAVQLSEVPEPSVAGLSCIGLVLLFLLSRRRTLRPKQIQ